MFKALSFFEIDPNWTLPDPEKVQGLTQANPFLGCGPTQEKATGWIPPRGVKGEPMLEVVHGQWLLQLQVEKKSVPAAVVTAEANAMATALERERGHRVSRRELKELKEEALLKLLPKAFGKKSSVLVWIDKAANRLVLNTTSTSLVDDALEEIGKLFSDASSAITMTPQKTAQEPSTAMASWLLEQAAPENFSFESFLELQQPDSDKATVRYTRHDIEIDEVVEHIKQGKKPSELALVWDEKIVFHLTAGLNLKKINLLDDVFEEDDPEAAESFEADAILYTSQLSLLITDLLTALKDEAEPIPEESKDLNEESVA